MKDLLKLGIPAALAVTCLLTSCNSRKELAEKIEGTWSSDHPEFIQVNEALSATATTFIQFNTTTDEVDPVSGTFMLSANFEASYQAPSSDMIVQPYTITTSGIASIQGKWTAEGDDEIMLTVDPSSFKVNVDPQTVVLKDNILTGENFTTIDSLKPQLAIIVEQGVTDTFKAKFLNIKEIDDIKVKGTKMECEILEKDEHFHRQAFE